jgi:hypothetical protein
MMFTNLLKATIGVALLPVTATVDIILMPSDAYEGSDFAPRSKAVIEDIKANIKEVTKP